MKYEPAPWTRYNPLKPWWRSCYFFPPTPGKEYKVRHGDDGVPFQAYFSYLRTWNYVDTGKPVSEPHLIQYYD